MEEKEKHRRKQANTLTKNKLVTRKEQTKTDLRTMNRSNRRYIMRFHCFLCYLHYRSQPDLYRLVLIWSNHFIGLLNYCLEASLNHSWTASLCNCIPFSLNHWINNRHGTPWPPNFETLLNNLILKRQMNHWCCVSLFHFGIASMIKIQFRKLVNESL